MFMEPSCHIYERITLCFHFGDWMVVTGVGQQSKNNDKIIHLMDGPEGNSQSCFPESPDDSRDEVEGNIRTRGKAKLTSFPRDHTSSVLLYI